MARLSFTTAVHVRVVVMEKGRPWAVSASVHAGHGHGIATTALVRVYGDGGLQGVERGASGSGINKGHVVLWPATGGFIGGVRGRAVPSYCVDVVIRAPA